MDDEGLLFVGMIMGVLVLCLILFGIFGYVNPVVPCRDYATLLQIETRMNGKICELNIDGLWVSKNAYVEFLEGEK